MSEPAYPHNTVAGCRFDRFSPYTPFFSAAALALVLAGQAAAGPVKRLERFKEQTAMITVTYSDRSLVHGAGVVLCQDQGRVQVLTAYDLFAGEGAAAGSYPSRTEIRFYGEGIAPVAGEMAGGNSVTLHRTDNLALLSLALSQPLPSTAGSHSGGFFSYRLHRQPAVVAVGHPRSSGEAWISRQGKLVAGAGGLLRHTASIDEGFVGGPLFNKRWLIGMNLRRSEGELTGAGVDQPYGEAMSIREILPRVAQWLSPRCRNSLEVMISGFMPEPAPDHLPTPAGSVTLYEHGWFGGCGDTFYRGDENLSDNLIGNDRASSIKVAAGCTATLYQHSGYRGTKTVLNADSDNLSTTKVGNDSVSSLEVSCDLPAEITAEGDSPLLDRSIAQAALCGQVDVEETSTPPSEGRRRSRLLEDAAAYMEQRRAKTAEPKRLKEHAVMITVTFEDFSAEQGAGTELCREGGRSYVLTAHHVLAGRRDAHLAERKVRQRTEVGFFYQDLPRVVADLKVHAVPDQDLALISFSGPEIAGDRERESLPWLLEEPFSAPEIRPANWARAVRRERPAIVALGYPAASMRTWATVAGTLVADTAVAGADGLVYHSAPIAEGYSGGPLFHASGPLIGINLERVPGETIGRRDGAFYGKALAIGEILPSIAPWLPAGCRRDFELELDRYRFFSAAERLAARWSSFSDNYRFGPYRVSGFKVRPESWSAPGRWGQRLDLSLDQDDGTVWEAECHDKTTAELEEEVNPGALLKLLRGRDVPLDQVTDASRHEYVGTFDCSFKERDGDGVVSFVLSGSDFALEVKGSGKISGAAGKIHLEAIGTRFDVWYLLSVDQHLIAAVHHGSVWLDPSMTGFSRSASVLASAVLLPYTGFYMPPD